ncbi:hypothetical protein EES43_05230 [Streptomyces sp. ADI96-02]|nr:hypothetical protein EES43_05230 [Streptomyces sp. ADI96-02]
MCLLDNGTEAATKRFTPSSVFSDRSGVRNSPMRVQPPRGLFELSYP